MRLQSCKALFRNIREWAFSDDYEIKWSNEWSISVGQGYFLIRHNKNLQIRINGCIIKLKLMISNL